MPPRRVTSFSDSARWAGFAHRPGDIVISTPAKCGTTWTQMLVALLVFQRPRLPAPLTALSPWLDMTALPAAQVHAALAAQRHRRFIKTHTPLSGLPLRADVTYIVVGRDPRDVMVSLEHHLANLDPAAVERVFGFAPPAPPAPDARVALWIDGAPHADGEAPQGLPGVVDHLADAWARRDAPHVVLLHYADLSRDLGGAMRALARRLDIAVPPERWPELVAAASLAAMRDRAAEMVPDERLGMFTDAGRFFRRGTCGQWRDVFTAADLARYDARLAALTADAGPGLREWLHHGSGGPGAAPDGPAAAG
ncbi:glycolipid sulfotransferase [Pilimelia terevasa]|uniref:Glycolipid sulfotransferase n=1 Tax=Pilimelia terevasa TaxID=53372 RepID=A0A8J3BTT6_9ACTN|nr:sulfotransferase domain-containing protein [Pilimelia terevasa]GGK35525.1 glycolipid sulfotransferase [Pilimelia terevasa]